LTAVWSDAPADSPADAWSGRRPPDSFTAEPYRYPGVRPDGSYAVGDGLVWGLDVVDGGWVDRDTRQPVDLTERSLVLAYGSNADPAKLSQHLTGTVLVLRCQAGDHAAVWCNARRFFDSAVVCTIEPAAGRVESHHVLAVTPEQLDRMDRWEGHPDRYLRRAFDGPVLIETGDMADSVLVYEGTPEGRPALRVDGRSLRVAEHCHDDVDSLVRG
jgi:hypothetical protein